MVLPLSIYAIPFRRRHVPASKSVRLAEFPYDRVQPIL